MFIVLDSGLKTLPLRNGNTPTSREALLEKAGRLQKNIIDMRNSAFNGYITSLEELRFEIHKAIEPMFSSPELSLEAPKKALEECETKMNWIRDGIRAQKGFGPRMLE